MQGNYFYSYVSQVYITLVLPEVDYLLQKVEHAILHLKVDFTPKVPHDKMRELYMESDMVLGSFSIGQLDTVAIEAMACGRPVVHSVSRKFFKTCPLEEIESIDEASEVIQKLLVNKKEREQRIKTQLAYVNATHAAPFLAERLFNIYSEVRNE